MIKSEQLKRRKMYLGFDIKMFSIVVVTFCWFTQACNNESKEQANYKNGQVKYTVNLINGKRDGELKKYFEDGSIMMVSNWENGLKHGSAISYFQNGVFKAIENFVKGKANGEFRYYDSLGTLLELLSVEDDKFHGDNIKYYGNGDLMVEQIYLNGKLNGKAVIYNRDGSIGQKIVYRNDSVVYAVEYDSEGNYFNNYMTVGINSNQSNSSRVGEAQNFVIKLEENFHQKAVIGVIFGRLDENLNLIDTLEGLKTDSLSYAFSRTYETQGLKKIEGVLYELTSKNKKHIENSMSFQYEIMIE